MAKLVDAADLAGFAFVFLDADLVCHCVIGVDTDVSSLSWDQEDRLAKLVTGCFKSILHEASGNEKFKDNHGGL